jgi:hypothetical protein
MEIGLLYKALFPTAHSEWGVPDTQFASDFGVRNGFLGLLTDPPMRWAAFLGFKRVWNEEGIA